MSNSIVMYVTFYLLGSYIISKVIVRSVYLNKLKDVYEPITYDEKWYIAIAILSSWLLIAYLIIIIILIALGIKKVKV